PIGELILEADQENITGARFRQEKDEIVGEGTTLLEEASKQLDQYFAGERQAFELPVKAEGTPFQERVWKILQTIPYGELWSYKQVALAIGQPRASRAVGMANNQNPIMIFIPCHRVIGSDGKLVGYAGGLDVKQQLLIMERQNTPIGGLWEHPGV
ncbi:MAG: methylated-DNA--[protein]-cysteine S-methyltransferase, partial [Bacteroides sp.]|nr:methylated-DNA--[protein]-cysteine S-methyltransferase [Bacteroides sp.]